MKKLITLFFVASGLVLFSQPAGKWATDGNAIQSGDFFGTLNNIPLDFRTNNVLQMSLGTNGVLSLKSLNGIGNRVLVTDASGNITALPSGLSNGMSSWDSNGNNIFFNGGNLGIGTSSPTYKLDVFGDARISNNLYVGGGIIVTDKLDAAVHVKAGDVIVNNDLSVTGNSRLSGVLTASQGVMFDAANGFKMYSGNSTTPDIFAFGRIGPSGPPTNLLPCLNITTLAINSFGGRVQAYDLANNIALTMGSDGVQSTIEHSGSNGLLVNYYCGKDIFLGTGTGTGAPNDPGGMAGASVFTGDKFYARKNVQIGNPGVALDNNVALNLFLNGTTSGLKLWSGAIPTVKLLHDNYDQFTFWGNGAVHFGNVMQVGFTNSAIQRADISVNINATEKMGISSLTTHSANGGYNTVITVNRALTKALAVLGPGGENFLVNGDGSAAIGGNYIPPQYKLAVYGNVICEELIVKLRQNWPDYVFSKKHNLTELDEIEKFTKQNKHLPGFESAKYYEKNGVALKEVVTAQQETIEKMMLYIIELKKEVDTLKNKTN